MRKRLLCMLLACAMLVGLLPAVGAAETDDIAIDVVIVLDRSDNMNTEILTCTKNHSHLLTCYQRRMKPAREIAKDIVDAVLNGSDNARVAIVSFAKEATVSYQFSKSKTLLKSTIGAILRSSDNGNVEAGLLKATSLLETKGRADAQKAVVLLSAGRTQFYYDPTDSIVLGTGLLETTAADDAALDQAHLMRDWGIDIYTVGIDIADNSHGEALLCAAQNKGYYLHTDSNIASSIWTSMNAEETFDTATAGTKWTAGFGKESIIPSDIPFLSYKPSDLPDTGLLYSKDIFGEDLSFDPADLTGTIKTAMDAYLSIDTTYATYPEAAREQLKASYKSFLNRVIPLDPPFNPATMVTYSATFDADYAAYTADVAAKLSTLSAALGTDGEADAVSTFCDSLPIYSLPETRYWMAGYGNDKPCLGYIDTAYARAIYLDDNTGRGGVLLIAVESVGMSRSVINEIRDDLAVFAHENNIRAIHIMCDHNHAMIDTMGMWGPLLLDSKDPQHMAQVSAAIQNAAVAAYNARTDGSLYVGNADARDQTQYTSPLIEDTRYPYETENANILTRFRFVPNDESKRDILLIHLPAHVEALYGSNLAASADYLAPLADYLEEEADVDFAFFVGAIGGLIRTTKEHEYPSDFVPRNDVHKYWIITQVTGKRIGELTLSVNNEFELAPKLNIATSNFEVEIDNFLLAAIAELGIIDTRVYIKDIATGLRETAEGFGNISVLTTALANSVAIYNQYKDTGLSSGELLSYSLASFAQTYFGVVRDNVAVYSTTEMSYIEFYQKNGTRTKAIVLVPGEMFPELVYGDLLDDVTGDLDTDPHNPTAENPETFVEIAARYGKSFGTNNQDLLVFGLSNDMTGYVVPPNDFVLNPTLPYINDYRITDSRKHYEETNSVGPDMAYVMADNFEALLAASLDN